MPSLQFAEDLVTETEGSWEGKHQDKGEILLGSSLAPAQASPSSGWADYQCQFPPLLSLQLMMLLTLSHGWKSLGNRKVESSYIVYL